MNSHKNYKELGLLQDFFRKNHKATFNCDQNKVEITSCDITQLLVKGKSNFQQAKFCLSGPVMHLRYQPLWFAILLGLNARQPIHQELQFNISLVELIEKSGRVCQALGIRQVNYTLAEVSYFLLLLIEFRIEIQKSNICQTCSVFTEISHDIDFQSISMASVTINPRVVDKLWELTNSASVFLTTLFFAKRPELYSLLQKLLSKTEEVSLSDIAPATFQHVQLLCRHGLVTYTKKHKKLDIHSVSVLIEGLYPL